MSTPRFDAERARAAAARLRYAEMREVMHGIRHRQHSSDRMFSVEMGVGGSILGIRLSPAAMDQAPEDLSEALVETINAGMAEIAKITNQVVAPFLSSADLDLAAITAGRLPDSAKPPPKADFAREIEEASRIPKRPLGRFAAEQGRYYADDDD